MEKKTFILSDQTKNHYGFVVLTAGINLDRFKKNPIMFYNHRNTDDDPTDVVGKWLNVRADGLQLLADPDIDTEEPKALILSKKVEKGLINGASIQLHFLKNDVSLTVPGLEGTPVVTKCEIIEASIASIPNNRNAVRLFIDGEQINDDSVAIALSLDHTNLNITKIEMKKIQLFAAALSLTFSDATTEEHILEGVKSKVQENESLKLQVAELTKKLNDEQDTKALSLVESGITAGKLKVEQKDHFVKLAKTDFASTKAIIDGLTAHTTISSQLNVGGKEAGKNPFDGKSYKELMKSADGSAYLSKLKIGTPDEKALLKSLWQESFPGGTYNA